MATGPKYRSQKVNRYRLSELMKLILCHIGNGIERGEIVEKCYGLERRYCGFYTDPCMYPKELRNYEHLYRKKQPVITKTLSRLEKRGLVRLLMQSQYVKKISLTEQGRTVVQELKSDVGVDSNGK